MCKVNLGPKEHDRLEGASNFVPWKFKLQILIEEVDLWEYVEKEIPEPIDLAQWITH